jgi:aminoglycoside phosphotransferase (APT) family kinase protein
VNLEATIAQIARAESAEILDTARYGDGHASTADRIRARLRFADGRSLTTLVKTARGGAMTLRALYANETAFYLGLRHELTVEAPRCFGAICDQDMFFLLLEDLTERGARFPDALHGLSADEVDACLDTLAELHAATWGRRIEGYASHVAGALHDAVVPGARFIVGQEVAADAFKAQLLDRLGTSVDTLAAGMHVLHRHQATLPPAVLHGDAHIGNTYMLHDGRAGLLDWQLTVGGAWVHDVGYFLATTLTAEERRARERDLLAGYLERLAAAGVDPPPFDDAWREYGRTPLWGLYFGWLTTPAANYGAPLLHTCLERLAAAYEDLGTARLIADLT